MVAHAPHLEAANAPAARRRSRPLGRALALVPPVDATGPRVRLGLAYFALAVPFLVAGGALLATAAAILGGAAAAQAGRGWRAHPTLRRFEFGGAAAVAVSAAFGLLPLVVAGVAVAVALLALRLAVPRWAGPMPVLVAPLLAVACGFAVGVPVALRSEGLAAAAVLVVCTFAYDASVFVMGAEARTRWEGHAFGAAAVVGVVLFSAAVLVPPFRGASPWILGAVTLVGLPAGTAVATALAGAGSGPVPALRRIDSLLVVSPLWAALAPALLSW